MSEAPKYVWPFPFEDITADFLSEIEALRDCMQYYFRGEGKSVMKDAAILFSKLPLKKILFIGNSYSYFASHVPKFILMQSRIEVQFTWECYEISEFTDYILPQELDPNVLFVFLSTSGKSRLIQQTIEQLRFLKVPQEHIWLISNNRRNHAIQSVGFHFPMCVDSEIVLGTKTFVNTILILYLICRIIMGENPISDFARYQVEHMLGDLEEYRKIWPDQTAKIMEFLGYDFKFLYFISNGASMSAAYHGALSAKSYCRFFAEAISRGIFFHGPFQIIDETFRCIVFAGDDLDDDASILLSRLMRLISDKLGMGKVVLFTNNIKLYGGLSGNPQIKIVNFHSPHPAFSPIYVLFMSQFLLLEIAKKRGVIPS
jgi:glucosamine 6-phosphate synthetase-like amidotransferase/phosphosugar isomerase protein